MIKRIGEAHYAQKFNAEILENDDAVERSFDLFGDSRFQIFVDTLNGEMIESANKGLVSGLKKASRKPIEPAYLKVFLLPSENVPVYLEYVTVLVIMLLLAIRGGRDWQRS